MKITCLFYFLKVHTFCCLIFIYFITYFIYYKNKENKINYKNVFLYYIFLHLHEICVMHDNSFDLLFSLKGK
jgi:hypothetical protein